MRLRLGCVLKCGVHRGTLNRQLANNSMKRRVQKLMSYGPLGTEMSFFLVRQNPCAPLFAIRSVFVCTETYGVLHACTYSVHAPYMLRTCQVLGTAATPATKVCALYSSTMRPKYEYNVRPNLSNHQPRSYRQH